ncbi:MAG: molybdopterin-guanine dinucleotide biosynthesis protein B [Acidobacteriota bacterium]
MIPLVSIVGQSGCGKTTLIERLIPELTGRGHRIATVKHDVHGFEMDREGKDTWRHKRAGAAAVAISSPTRVAVIADVDRELTLEEVCDRFMRDVDMVLCEGFKTNPVPKIELFRTGVSTELLCNETDRLLAVVSDRLFSIGVPCFGLDEIPRIADLIQCEIRGAAAKPELSLYVGRAKIPLTPFAASSLAGMVRGYVGALKECDPSRSIELLIGADDETLPRATR